MIFVTNRVRRERLKTCDGCKWFVPETHSCGTYYPKAVMKGKVKRETVTEKIGDNDKTFKLCGCDMRQKSKWKVAKCPAGKWNAEVTQKVMREMSKIIRAYEGKEAMKKEDAERLILTYNKAFGANEKLTTCTPCLRRIFDEAKASVNEYNEK